MSADTGPMLSFGDHLEALRGVLVRVVAVVVVAAVCAFVLKDQLFAVLLAPGSPDFCTYRALARAIRLFDANYTMAPFHVDLIATEISAQFMAHLTVAAWAGALVASPYVVWQLFGFVRPALLERERRYAVPLVAAMYVLFALGVALTYFVLFPVAFRFLGTYSVSAVVRSQITIDSYVQLFGSLALAMSLVFQLPVLTFVLARLGLVRAETMAAYRRHAVVGIMLVAAVITPPDVLSLVLVALPLCALYEVSVVVAKTAGKVRN